MLDACRVQLCGRLASVNRELFTEWLFTLSGQRGLWSKPNIRGGVKVPHTDISVYRGPGL